MTFIKCISTNDNIPMFKVGQVYNLNHKDGKFYISVGVFDVEVHNTQTLIWENVSNDAKFIDSACDI